MNSLKRILIIDDLHPVFMDRLKSLEIDYDYLPDIQEQEVINVAHKYDAIAVRSKMRFDKDFLENNKQLVLIARAGSGLDNIDTLTADELGVTCLNAPEGNCDAVGEQTIATLLAISSNIVKGHNEIKTGLWDREGNRGFEIKNKTIGIVGYGNTGSAVARKISGFGCKIMAYDLYKSGFNSETVCETSLDDVLKTADIISFHVPLTELTEQWIDDSFINSVAKPFILLNLCRGGIMNTASINSGLDSGKIIGFGSDVLENENLNKLSNNQRIELDKLLMKDNVVLTPHVGGWTTESYKRISEVLGNKIESWCKSENKAENRSTRSRHFVG